VCLQKPQRLVEPARYPGEEVRRIRVAAVRGRLDRGAFSYERYPVRLSRTPATVQSRAPVLAEHNQYVFGELLQMSEAEINSLRERGVI